MIVYDLFQLADCLFMIKNKGAPSRKTARLLQSVFYERARV